MYNMNKFAKYYKKTVSFRPLAHLYGSFEMEKNIDYVRLVQQAQLGDRECLTNLSEMVSERLYSYVYRYTLAGDLTRDIVQDTILKMLEVLDELKEADRFWPWLYKIALNKIRLHHRKEQHHRSVSDPDKNPDHNHKNCQEAVANIVYQEFKEIVFAAMRELKPEHRSIINMRCYDDMRYSEIAEVIGRSEFATQMLFYRAKKSLKKQLTRHGFGKGSLLMALVLFGKLTAPSKAAASQVTVTSAAIKVGVSASVSAIAASKTAIVTLTTAGALTVGSMVATSGPEKYSGLPTENMAKSSYVLSQDIQAPKDNQEYWYYYPSKASNTVMMRVKGSEKKGNHRYCRYLQNAKGNYYFDRQKNTVYIENYRQWQKDLSVWRLPTDSSELTEFLAQVDGKTSWLGEVYRSQSGSLLIVKQPGIENNDELEITNHYNVLGEDYFKYDWPANAKVVDNRDVMHKRGWTYFTVAGNIEGRKVTGKGQLPFVYAESRTHWPWIKLHIGGEVFVDETFTGLARPWMGLHTIDTVRRDAAEKQIPFETGISNDGSKAEIVVTNEQVKLVYTIDMKRDVVEKIVFSTADKNAGELRFDYLQDIEGLGRDFSPPRKRKNVKSMWLFELINNY